MHLLDTNMDKQTIEALMAMLEDIRARLERVESKIEASLTKEAHALICASREPTREAIAAITAAKERMGKLEKIVYGGVGAVLVALIGVIIAHIAK